MSQTSGWRLIVINSQRAYEKEDDIVWFFYEKKTVLCSILLFFSDISFITAQLLRCYHCFEYICIKNYLLIFAVYLSYFNLLSSLSSELWRCWLVERKASVRTTSLPIFVLLWFFFVELLANWRGDIITLTFDLWGTAHVGDAGHCTPSVHHSHSRHRVLLWIHVRGNRPTWSRLSPENRLV